jgi:UMF1 family MFS transporter
VDQLTHQPDRLAGPLVAGFLAIGAIPLFLFSKDAPTTNVSVFAAFRRGFSSLSQTVRSLGGERNAALYLISRMLYTDGMTALLATSGVYAAGVMHWGTLQMLAYGILLSIAAVFGGLLGGTMDALFGPSPGGQDRSARRAPVPRRPAVDGAGPPLLRHPL